MSLGRKIFKLFSCIFACAFFTCAGMSVANADTTASYVFTVTTTNMSVGDSFSFSLAAKGTFYVDCDGGTLTTTASPTGITGSVSSGWTINRASNLTEVTYTCSSYSTAGQKNIRFGGLATEYDVGQPSIKFTTPAKVSSLTGNLSSIFRYLGSGSGQHPEFRGTFAGCVNLTSVPASLFGNFTSIPGSSAMFWGTFSGSGLTTIPKLLFSRITTGAESMFNQTFENCTQLTTIPSELFDGITVGADNMFGMTFKGCSGLRPTTANNNKPIPDGLFSNITSGATDMFAYTFSGCTQLKSIPATLFEHITSTKANGDPTMRMFNATFSGCTQLESIPSGLFSSITTGANYMFGSTFSGCTSLKYLPENLFANITTLTVNNTTVGTQMFNSTFKGCSGLMENTSSNVAAAKWNFIPKSFFAGMINENNPSQSLYTTDMMKDIFKNTSLRTCCPAGYENYITGYESHWDQHVSCTPCAAGYTSTQCGSCVPSVTLQYNCNNTAGQGLSGQYPQGTSMWATDHAPNCTPPANSEFVGWYCTEGNDYNDGVPVSVTGSINGLSTPQVHETFLCSGTACYFTLMNPTMCVAVWRTANPCPNGTTMVEYVLGTPASESVVDFEATNSPYGTVTVESMCSKTEGMPYYPGTPSSNIGIRSGYCWCRLTQFDPVNNGSTVTFSNGEYGTANWVFVGSTANCSDCQNSCESAVNIDSFALFRESLYTTYQCINDYTLTYDCNNANLGATGNQNTQVTLSSGTEVTVDETVANNYCQTPSGYEFVTWVCSWGTSGSNNLALSVVGNIAGDSVTHSGNTYYVPINSNLIGWNSNNANTNSFYFNIEHDTDCVAVWRPTSTCLNNGQSVGYVLWAEAGTTVANALINTSGTQHIVYDDPNSPNLENADFYVEYSYGSVYVEAMCSPTPGVAGVPGNPVETNIHYNDLTGDNPYCWCRVRGWCEPNTGDCLPSNGSYSALEYMPWVMYNGEPGGDCNQCAYYCSKIRTNMPRMLEGLYTTELCRYNVSYNCNNSGVVNPAPTSVTMDQTYTLADISNCGTQTGKYIVDSGNNIIGNGWKCEANNTSGTYLNANSGTWQWTDSYTCTAQWASYSLSYNCGVTGSDVSAVGNGPASQSFAGVNSVTISNPGNTCTATGYSFDGWWCYDNNAGFYSGNIYTPNSSYAYGNGSATCVARWKANDPCAPGTLDTANKEVLGILMPTEEMNDPENTWKDHFSLNSLWGPDAVAPDGVNGNEVTFPYGTIVLEGLCSMTSGIPGQVGYPDTTNTDQHCWCRVAKFEGEELTDYPWVYYQDFASSGTNCSVAKCSEVCANGVYNDWNDSHDFYLNFLHSLYVKNICLYTLRYKCDSSATATYGGSYADGVNVPLWNSATTATNCPSQAANGQELDVWTCDNNVTVNNNSIYMPANNVTCTASWKSTNYTVTFLRGDSNNDGSGVSATGTMSPTTGLHYNNTVTLPPNGFTPPFGFVFSRWWCDNSIGYKYAGTTFTMPAANVQCTAQWVRSTVNLMWELNGGTMPTYESGGNTLSYTNPPSCTYGMSNGISTVYQPNRPGYSFLGWKVTDWDECGLRSLDVSLTASHMYAKTNDNTCKSFINNVETPSNCSDSVYGDLNAKEWKDIFSYGTVYGVSYCGTNAGTSGQAGNPGSENGQNCWCAVTKFVPSGGNACIVSSPSYVFYQTNSHCSTQCTEVCANQTGWSYIITRPALYGQTQ